MIPRTVMEQFWAELSEIGARLRKGESMPANWWDTIARWWAEQTAGQTAA